jgi:hypothetical protein
MRTSFVECPPEYGNYHFPYRLFAEIEAGEDAGVAYTGGFLPYSANIEERRLLFYRARSLRLELPALRLNKKRRYLQRQGTRVGFSMHLQTLHDFLLDPPPDWKSVAISWIAKRHAVPFMNLDRLNYVLDRPFLSHVMRVHLGENWVGVVLLPMGSDWAHYWYCLYDPDLCSLISGAGKWMLGQTALACQQLGKNHLYLGTAYGKKSHYKFHGMQGGVEFFDGNGWSESLTELRQRLNQDPA